MPFATVGDTHMFYQDLGVPDGRPIVMIHGFAGTGNSDWTHQIDRFTPGFRLIVPDLRGHGRTNNPSGRDAMNYRQFAADIAMLCDQLGIARAAFFGESAGSMLQLSLALNRPDLMATAVLTAASYFLARRTSGLPWHTQTVDSLAATWFPSAQALEDFTAMHTALGSDHGPIVIGDFIGISGHAHTEDFPDPQDLERISTPILLVHGDRDHHFAPEIACALYRQLPNAELCVLPNTLHWPPTEQPMIFNILAADFLTRTYHDNRDTQQP